MESKKRINYINDYLKEKFGERTLKIGIDGGFTCPNRDGKKGVGGCIFCSKRGSGEHLSSNLSIEEQIDKYFNSYKSSRANKFILYFQNYSNTYDTIENLKRKYDLAISTAQKVICKNNLSKEIVGISIATRPDCINEAICDLLASYTSNYYVSVELGLQTANDNIGAIINRCYTSQDFENAVKMLNKNKIDTIAHIMVGLPGETHNDIANTISFLNKLKIQGIKIHSTYIVKNTMLEQMYNNKEYTPISLDDYLNEVIFIITHLRSDIVIHRISGDAPKNLLVAPEWNLHKKWVMNGVTQELEKNDLYQGMYLQEKKLS